MIYDYIIVGGGSAGCVAANRLVLDHGARVLLIEKGPMDDSAFIRMPAGTFKMMFSPSPFLKRYKTEPQASLDGRSITIAQANVVGGGSSVNMMGYVRGCVSDYAKWDEATGGAGWAWQDLLPYFIRQEGNTRLVNASHGADGPLRISDNPFKCKAADIFVDTMTGMGTPFTDDFGAGSLTGVGYSQTTTFKSERCSSAKAFLHPILDNPLLTLVTSAAVTKIKIEAGRATGVSYSVAGKSHEASASSEVILAAGAFVSPKLLMLSGIGPALHLAEHGIPLVQDLPGVGQNLQDHNMIAAAFSTQGQYGYHTENSGLKLLRNLAQYLLLRSGPLASNGGETIAYVNLDDAEADPALQVVCVGILWPDAQGKSLPMHGLSLVASLLQPKSRGSVRLRSADPAEDPLIDPQWLAHPDDQAGLLNALKYLRKIATNAPLSKVLIEEINPGPSIVTDDGLLAYIRRNTETNYHPVGTCRMGLSDDPMTVVTPDLKVKGVLGLRVIDASIMPTIIRANVNATVMAVADKAVDLITRSGVSPSKRSPRSRFARFERKI